MSWLLASSEHRAACWETPPITTSRLTRSFEFVLLDAPYLETAPEPEVFGPYFATEPPGTLVLTVPNLGRTAQLVVPRAVVAPEGYTHLLAFLRHAPAAQIHALWQQVAETVKQAISDEPLWTSTAGGGVSWLHVRIERVPKYYRHRPYARFRAGS